VPKIRSRGGRGEERFKDSSEIDIVFPLLFGNRNDFDCGLARFDCQRLRKDFIIIRLMRLQPLNTGNVQFGLIGDRPELCGNLVLDRFPNFLIERPANHTGDDHFELAFYLRV